MRTSLLAFLLLCCTSAYAQLHSDDWAMGATMSLPAGMSAMAVSHVDSASGGPAISKVSSFTYTTGSEIRRMLTSSTQLCVGLGVGLVSFSTSAGTPPDSRTTVAASLGLRQYLKPSAEVSPFFGINAGYTIIPTVIRGNSETNGSLLMGGVCFGVQAFISKSVAVFSQMGLAYTSGSMTEKLTGIIGTTTTTAGESAISLGGSAIGFCIYW